MALFLTYFSYFSLRPTLLGFVNKVCNLKFYIFQFPSFRNFFTQYGINMITLQHQDIELLLQQQLPHKLLLVSMKQIMVTQQLPSTSQVIIIGLLNYTRNICFGFEKLKNSLGFLINKYTVTMQGLDTVESLSAEASGNLSTNRNYLISIIVSGTNLVAVQPLYDILLNISTKVS